MYFLGLYENSTYIIISNYREYEMQCLLMFLNLKKKIIQLLNLKLYHSRQKNIPRILVQRTKIFLIHINLNNMCFVYINAALMLKYPSCFPEIPPNLQRFTLRLRNKYNNMYILHRDV